MPLLEDKLVSLADLKEAYDNTVHGIKGSAESGDYRTGDVIITAANVGALPSNTTLVSGVKGDAESSYRSGQVNITPANIGALTKELNRDTFNDLNDQNLVGHTVLNNTDWSNMPGGVTSGSKWFDVYLFGFIQMAVGFSDRGMLWVRTRTNNEWTPWQLVGGGTFTGTVTTQNGVTVSSQELRRNGSVCSITLWLSISDTIAGNGGNLALIPEAFRPADARFITGWADGYSMSQSGAQYLFRITPIGYLQTATGSGSFTGGTIRIGTTYII